MRLAGISSNSLDNVIERGRPPSPQTHRPTDPQTHRPTDPQTGSYQPIRPSAPRHLGDSDAPGAKRRRENVGPEHAMCSWTPGGWKRQGILQPLAHHHQRRRGDSSKHALAQHDSRIESFCATHTIIRHCSLPPIYIVKLFIWTRNPL